ncbi:hypothetical protein FA15DRAFT_670072 [Coprinopsis marcescibilis]|uniref:Uncharacterized protein n=1 Tax=Coprinopsis marcescibilis TaxID=230819 RepID=A0A5C3KTT8_COPMA|nr:hypothetical protein FA15DRAFT_670072 [Coprinopsis marcescibilis]
MWTIWSKKGGEPSTPRSSTQTTKNTYIPDIPQELFDLIIEHAALQLTVANYRRRHTNSKEANEASTSLQNLLSWSLVSRAFLLACRKYAFRDLELDVRFSQRTFDYPKPGSTRIQALLYLLRGSKRFWKHRDLPHLGEFVQVLRITQCASPLVPRIVEFFPRLQALLYRANVLADAVRQENVLEALDETREGLLSEDALLFKSEQVMKQFLDLGLSMDSLESCITGIRQLNIKGHGADPPFDLADDETSDTPERTLCLDRLYVRESWQWNTAKYATWPLLLDILHLTHTRQWSMTIRRLELHNCASTAFKEIISTPNGRLALESVKDIVITVSNKFTTESFMPVLSACKDNLESLELSFPTECALQPPVLDLKLFPQLKRIYFVNYPMDKDENQNQDPVHDSPSLLNQIIRHPQKLYGVKVPSFPTGIIHHLSTLSESEPPSRTILATSLTRIHIHLSWFPWGGFGEPGYMDKVLDSISRFVRVIEDFDPSVGERRRKLPFRNLTRVRVVVFMKGSPNRWTESGLTEFHDKLEEAFTFETGISSSVSVQS